MGLYLCVRAIATAAKTRKQEDEPQPQPSPVSTPAEKKQAAERAAISAGVVYEAIRREGEDELKRPSAALAWSGLAAGLAMGFSLVAEGLLAARLPESGWRPLISKLGYSVGFLMVILGRQQLYTENSPTVILPLLLRKNAATLASVARLWTVVLICNLLGTYLFCAMHWEFRGVQPARAANAAQCQPGRFGRRLRGGAYASRLCGLADCADGLAAARSGVVAGRHHNHNHLPHRLGRLSPHHRGLQQKLLPDGERRGVLGLLLFSIFSTHATGEYYWRSFPGGFSESRAGSGW